MSDDKWLLAAETLAHVSAAMVAVGGKADDAARAIYQMAAIQPYHLAAFAPELSRSTATVGRGWATNPFGMRVAPRFWQLMLSAPVALDWANGCFTAKALDDADRDMDNHSELWVAGVRFRRQQVEALWPISVVFNKPTTYEIIDRLAASVPGGNRQVARMKATDALQKAEELGLFPALDRPKPRTWQNAFSLWKQRA